MLFAIPLMNWLRLQSPHRIIRIGLIIAMVATLFGAIGTQSRGALVAMAQRDWKRLVAYSSVSHMGFVLLGIAAAAKAIGTQDATIALNGAVLQMFNHGLSAAGMFFLVGVIYERTHTRIIEYFGGSLWVESRPGQGATFVFTLPLHGGRPAQT